jgi:hypothetical protein
MPGTWWRPTVGVWEMLRAPTGVFPQPAEATVPDDDESTVR